MHRYQHILVTLDLSPEDDRPVTERALEIAKGSRADVSFLHVVEPFYNYVSPYVVEAISEWQDQTLKAAQDKMSEFGEKYGISSARQLVTVGQARSEIHRVAKEVKADLILVGSHGRHGLSLFLHGSTANEVIQYAECDVLAVNVQAAVSGQA